MDGSKEIQIEPRRRRLFRGPILFALLLSAAVGLSGAANEHRARLSDDLLRHLASQSSSRVRVIVKGSKSSLWSLAAKHHVAVARWLEGGAVFEVNSTELARLSAESILDSVSGDPLVTPSMSVSNQSTLASQTRAGSGGLVGIGSIPGVTGAGIGVAIVDSGIAPHKALTNKVVANVSFVTGDPSTDDAY